MTKGFMDYLTGGYKQSTGSNNNGGTQQRVNKATAGQIKYYLDLCTQRSLAPEDTSTMDFDTISAKIKELLAFKPASQKQIDTIIQKLQNVAKLLERMNFSEEQLAKFEDNTDLTSSVLIRIINKDTTLLNIIPKLTGGLEGSASKLIGGLIEIEKLYADVQPPTEAQIEMLIGMYLCPDVNFEDFDVERTVQLEGMYWRKMSPQEFKDELMAVLNKNSASQLIETNRGAFYEWKKTRIRPEQMRYIQSLEGRLSDDSKIGSIEYSVDMEGNITETVIKNEQVKGVAYVPLTDEQLIMLSIDEASEMIDQLKSELERREESSFTEPEIDYSELRSAKSVEQAIEIEYKDFEDLMYKLQSVAGYEDDELHEVANFNLVANNDADAQIKNREKIRGFMKDLLETESITFYELLELTRDSITAQKILLDF